MGDPALGMCGSQCPSGPSEICNIYSKAHASSPQVDSGTKPVYPSKAPTDNTGGFGDIRSGNRDETDPGDQSKSTGKSSPLPSQVPGSTGSTRKVPTFPDTPEHDEPPEPKAWAPVDSGTPNVGDSAVPEPTYHPESEPAGQAGTSLPSAQAPEPSTQPPIPGADTRRVPASQSLSSPPVFDTQVSSVTPDSGGLAQSGIAASDPTMSNIATLGQQLPSPPGLSTATAVASPQGVSPSLEAAGGQPQDGDLPRPSYVTGSQSSVVDLPWLSVLCSVAAVITSLFF